MSHVADVIHLADRAVSVGDLVAGQTMFAVEPHIPAISAHRELSDLDYRWAPVTDVPIRRFVELADLDGSDASVAQVAKDITGDLLISESAHLTDFINHMRTSELAFVTHGRHIVGIITWSDLQQPAVGLYCFGLITALEAGLDELIERHCSQNWTTMLSDDRLEDVYDIMEERRRDDLEMGLLSCLNLDDRLTIAGKVRAVSAPMGLLSGRQVNDAGKDLKRVRDNLAHGNTVMTAIPNVGRLLDFLDRLRRRALAVWGCVEGDPDLVEAQISSRIEVLKGDGWLDVSSDRHELGLPPERLVYKVTAHNPGATEIDDDFNDRATTLLRKRLAQDEILTRRARAGSRGHWEEGFVISGVDRTTACQLGADFGQVSVFEVSPSELRVVDCASGKVLASRPSGGS